MLKHTKTVLPSGLPILTIPMDSVDSVTVMVLCNTGSRYETSDKQGIAHFFEHMVFKGTKQFPTAQDLAAVVDGVGADFNAFTSKEYTGYFVKSAAGHIDLALDVVSDMLLQPKLRQEDIDKEKGVIIEELNMYQDMPARHVADEFERLMFEDQSLGHNIVGTKETIKSMTAEDFRDFLSEHYGLANMLLVVAGQAKAIQDPAFLKKVAEVFGKDAGSRKNDKHAWAKQLKISPVKNDRWLIINKTTQQAHFVLGWPSINRFDDKRYALSLLSVILGGNMSSRLFTEVREKRGLCYYVHSDSDMYHDTGSFGASAGVDVNRLEEALEVTLKEFWQIASGQKLITQNELKKAKDYLEGKTILGLEDSESVAQYYGMRLLLTDKIETPEQILAKIKAVTLDQVNDLAKFLIKPNSVRLALIGPFENEQKFIELVAKVEKEFAA